MKLLGLLSCLLCMTVTASCYDTSHLDAALHYYETMHADQVIIHTPHSLPARKHVSFQALGRDFNLHLKPDKQILAGNFAVYEVDSSGQKHQHKVDRDAFLHGYLEGEDSRVTAYLSEDGVLSAVMATPTETYHVEPSAHYIDEAHDFHMVLYARSHVKPRLNATRMDFAIPSTYQNPNIIHNDAINFYSTYDNGIGTSRERYRREASSRGNIAGDFCNMILIADYSTFMLFGSVSSASSQIVLLVSSVNLMIFKQTEWLVDVNNKVVTGLGLTIQQVLVHTASTADRNNYTTDRTDVKATDILSFMRLSSLWQNYCLAHLFTNRHFPSGLLGLANIASPLSSQTGGICSTRFRDANQDLVIYNTGLSSYNNNGNTMILSEMIRVTGHELGHNWGSHHDPSECSNFLMNEYSQDGSRDTHIMFSKCSRRSIGEVLLSKGHCFVNSLSGQCQDYRKDSGEECDAGPNGGACCTPDCMLRPDATCSEYNSLCCRDCQVANSSVVCRSAPRVTPDCTGETLCNGQSVDCPSTPSPATEGQHCIRGFCRRVNSSEGHMNSGAVGVVVTECVEVCSTFCTCQGEDECLVCCEVDEECVTPNATIPLATGSPCSEGICDNGVCLDRTQDVVTRVWRIITTLDINALKNLIKENIVGFVLIFTFPLCVLSSCLTHQLIDKPLLKKFMKGEEHTDIGMWYYMRSMKKQFNVPPISEREVMPLISQVEEETQFIDPVDDDMVFGYQ